MAPIIFTPIYVAFSIDVIHLLGIAIAAMALVATYLAVTNAKIRGA
jgi:hypothetical protein